MRTLTDGECGGRRTADGGRRTADGGTSTSWPLWQKPDGGQVAHA